MPDYGFTISVKGNSVQEMKRIESELSRLGITARDTGKATAEAMEPLSAKLSEIGTKLGEVFAIRELFHFGKEILNTTAEFEGFENRIKFASRNSYDAAENMAFLRDEVTKLHMPLRQAYEGFSEMQAGLVGTGIEGDRLRSLFAGISTAAATLHLPEYSLQRTLLDFKEIGEIGLNRRIYRSLGTALPGIGGVIKEAFGKSFDELEKSGISGSEFLAKIGPALEKRFSSGLANWGQSLQAKLTDTKNSVTNLMLDLGTRLEPTFVKILNGIQGAFNSAPVQYLVEHINDLVAVVGRIIPMWAAYKTIMAIVNSVTMETGILFKIIEGAQLTLMFGFEGLSVAVGGFSTLLAGIGWGALAAGIGYAVVEIINMNDEIKALVDSITNLDDIAQKMGGQGKRYTDIQLMYSTRGTMNDEEKSHLYKDLGDQSKQFKDLAERNILPSLNKAREQYAGLQATFHDPARLLALNAQGPHAIGIANEAMKQLPEKIAELSSRYTEAQGKALTLAGEQRNLMREGVKAIKEPPLTGGEPSKNGLHGSHLSGAEGGLNQARIVNLTIGEVMHVVTSDNKNLVGHAEQAAQYIARALDNISESRSGTQ